MKIDFEAYGQECQKTAVYPKAGTGDIAELSYIGLGLAGEGGELVDVIKKCVRDGTLHVNAISEERRLKMIDEAGDVFWYLGQFLRVLNVSLGQVLDYNQNKLLGRYKDKVEEEEEEKESTTEFFACRVNGDIHTNTITKSIQGVFQWLEVMSQHPQVEIVAFHLPSQTDVRVKAKWDSSRRIMEWIDE